MSGLPVSHSESTLPGGLACARRPLDSQKRRSPARAGGSGGSRGWPGAPTWSSAYVIIPGVVLQYGADAALAETHYEGVAAHVNFLARQAGHGDGVPQFGMLGDWCAVEGFCPGSSDGCLADPGWTSGDATSAFYFIKVPTSSSQLLM